MNDNLNTHLAETEPDARDTVFISHATPEDNSFAIWLASRLGALGYKVWVDKNEIVGGEKFWEDIDLEIRRNAVKFVLVYSKNICVNCKPGYLKDGISKEYSLSESISKQFGLRDFAILLNVDSSPYNLFIGADRLSQIPFYENWAEGLNQLLRKLDKDGVPRKGATSISELGRWYENEYVLKNGIIATRELYYTNLLPISRLPNVFYLFQFEAGRQAKAIQKNAFRMGFEFPISRVSNVLASFSSDIPLNLKVSEDMSIDASLKDRFEIGVEEVFSGFERSTFPSQRDAANHLKALLRQSFQFMLERHSLRWYQLANRSRAYFYTPESPCRGKVTFQYLFHKEKRKKKKVLLGKYLDLGTWHYALSCIPVFEPFLAFNLKSHLIFTTDGFTPWNDVKRMHTHRRSKGRRLFNSEWRDMLLAFLNGLKNDGENIEIPLNSDFELRMKPYPFSLRADFGYVEPKNKDRQEILDPYEESSDAEA